MWIFRELARLLSRIFVAVLIAIVIAEVRALVGGGDTTHTFRWVLLALGGVFLLLGGTGTGSTASRVVNWGEVTPGKGGTIFRGFRPRPEDPTLTSNAVFIASGVVLLVLGAVV
jgi:hypothetical protein